MSNTTPNTPTIFTFRDHPVREIADAQGNPWFMVKDVCDILGLENVGMALARIPESHLTSIRLMSGGQIREMKAVDEPGLYRLILRSDKPEAEPFMEWVTAEVLPAIRKTGGYAFPGLPEPGRFIEDKQITEVTFRANQVAKLARTLGYRGDRARLMVRDTVQEATGIDVLELLGVREEVEAVVSEELFDDPRLPARGSEALKMTSALAADFIEARCRLGAASRVPAADLHTAFCEWYTKINPSLPTPSGKSFFLVLSRHFRKYKTGGNIVYFGLALNQEVDEEVRHG